LCENKKATGFGLISIHHNHQSEFSIYKFPTFNNCNNETNQAKSILTIEFMLVFFHLLGFTPIDGFWAQYMRRLLRLQFDIGKEKLRKKTYTRNVLKSSTIIQLNFLFWDKEVICLGSFTCSRCSIAKSINGLFPDWMKLFSGPFWHYNLVEGNRLFWHQRQEIGFQLEVWGKLAVLTGMFGRVGSDFISDSYETELPCCALNCKRQGHGDWTDSTSSHYKWEPKNSNKSDTVGLAMFTLFEWADIWWSVSNNGAECLWRRKSGVVRAFGEKYSSFKHKKKPNVNILHETLKDWAHSLWSGGINIKRLNIGEWRMEFGAFLRRWKGDRFRVKAAVRTTQGLDGSILVAMEED